MEKIDEETISITSDPVVRRINIKELKRSLSEMQLKRAFINKKIDEIKAIIDQAKLVGVE